MKKQRVHITLFIFLFTLVYTQGEDLHLHTFSKDVQLNQEDVFKSSLDQKGEYATNEFLSVSYLFSNSDTKNEIPLFEKGPFYFLLLSILVFNYCLLFIDKLIPYSNFIALHKSLIRLFPFHSFW